MKPVKRAGTIRIRVSYQVQDRMQSISDRFGVPVSTLAALAVGKWLTAEERGLSMVDQAMAGVIDAASDEARNQVAAAANEQMNLYGKKEAQ